MSDQLQRFVAVVHLVRNARLFIVLLDESHGDVFHSVRLFIF